MGWELPSAFPIRREWIKASHSLKGAVEDRRMYPKNGVMPRVTQLRHSHQKVNNPACHRALQDSSPSSYLYRGLGQEKGRKTGS